MHKFDTAVMLPDTDAAGILFYGNYFRKSHEAYEFFMEGLDFGLEFVVNESECLLLIAHAEADFRSSLKLGERYSILTEVEKLGGKSFTLKYDFVNAAGTVCASIRTIHVAVDKKSGKTTALPETLREKLAQHR
ncbi:MAG: acyl-CoA thioesterase [Candidatus Zixiibacteriota bacterium]|nr:MAG: acyl-CoA thioesterase [candidate division Zixibacteria bacterium]